MLYLAIGIGGGFAFGILAAFIVAAIRKASQRKRSRKMDKRKFEFSKILILLVLFTYFVGVFVGVWIVFLDFPQLSVLLMYIGSPTVSAIGFYVWKAKAENMIKIKRDNPQETKGIKVDLNNIQP